MTIKIRTPVFPSTAEDYANAYYILYRQEGHLFERRGSNDPVEVSEAEILSRLARLDHDAILDKLNTRVGPRAATLLLENTTQSALIDIIASLTGITTQEAALFVENRK